MLPLASAVRNLVKVTKRYGTCRLRRLAFRVASSASAKEQRAVDPEWLWPSGSKASIERVPTDASRNRTQRRRALESMPWAPGDEPLQGAAEARRILTKAP